MGQVCSVLREKILGSKNSQSDTSSVLIVDDDTRKQNYGKLDIEDQHDDTEVVSFEEMLQDPPPPEEVSAIVVESQVVNHNINVSPPPPVEALIDITNQLPTESKTISQYVTPRPPLKSSRERSNSSSSDQSSKKMKADDYLNFPIFNHSLTKQFIPQSKVMLVLRGLSGSGKSQIAAQLVKLYGDDSVECSADNYFVQPDGEYKFDFEKIKDAHAYCFNLAKTEMASGRPLVIINNTNVKLWEYKRYLSLATEHHYLVLLMQPQTPWAWDPVQLAQRTQHSVDEHFLKDKLKMFQRGQPVYYGWYLNLADSSLLVQRSWACLRAVAELPQCRRSLAHYCYRTAPEHMQGGASELASYYKLCGDNGAFRLLHCTAMFSNRGKAPGSDEYHQRVEADMGRAFNVLVTGFIITPRTIGVRVVLPDEALPLWEKDDQDDTNRSEKVNNLFALVQGEDAEQLALEEEGALDGEFDAEQLTVAVPDEGNCTATTRSVPFERVQQLCGDEGPSLHRLRPYRRRSSRRAHLTVAVAPNVSAVTTGFDLMHLIGLEDAAAEQQATSGRIDGAATGPDGGGEDTVSGAGLESMEVERTKARQFHAVEGGTLADYGKGVFAFYPNECLEITTLFSASY